ncbi:MAG: tRNA pseudouridine(13) synthase TruD [archaeon]|nr:tRNA pseudouridine(13) synthase TruD [archaeon]
MKQSFSTTSKPIGGRIKQRISDFKVREITLDGTICETTFDENANSARTMQTIPAQPDREYSQLHLILEKFNTDEFNAVRILTRFIGTSKKRIGFAGVKDKRGITSQKISFFNPNIERLQKMNLKYIKLSNPEWKKERIEIGDLKGNEFEVTIRNIEGKEKEIKKTIEDCFKQLQKGIANYFGEQRFGGIREVTHLVGKKFIKKQFKEAVMMYLTYTNEKEEESIRNARIELEKTNDFQKAVNDFSPRYRYERMILQHLCKYPNDFIGAFRTLPKSLQYMFVHSYQSFLFNKIIEERIKQGIGIEKTKGDELIDGIPTVALFGFESTFAEGKPGKIEKKILKEDGVELSEFLVKEFPELSSKGARKKIAIIPENLKLLEISADEFNENKLKAVISFRLDKGNYATTVLREITKTQDSW